MRYKGDSELIEFNYKGVVFQAETDIDSDNHSLILMEVLHKGENITKCLNDSIIIEMEEAINAERETQSLLADHEAKERV